MLSTNQASSWLEASLQDLTASAEQGNTPTPTPETLGIPTLGRLHVT